MRIVSNQRHIADWVKSWVYPKMLTAQRPNGPETVFAVMMGWCIFWIFVGGTCKVWSILIQEWNTSIPNGCDWAAIKSAHEATMEVEMSRSWSILILHPHFLLGAFWLAVAESPKSYLRRDGSSIISAWRSHPYSVHGKTAKWKGLVGTKHPGQGLQACRLC